MRCPGIGSLALAGWEGMKGEASRWRAMKQLKAERCLRRGRPRGALPRVREARMSGP